MSHVENIEVKEHWCFCSEVELISSIIIIIIVLDQGKCRIDHYFLLRVTRFMERHWENQQRHYPLLIWFSVLQEKKVYKMRTSQYVWQMLTQVNIELDLPKLVDKWSSPWLLSDAKLTVLVLVRQITRRANVVAHKHCTAQSFPYTLFLLCFQGTILFGGGVFWTVITMLDIP